MFDDREPNPLEWYFLSGTDPVRTVRPDGFYTWELRNHYGQTPSPAEADYQFDVVSVVDARRFLSLVPFDSRTKAVGASFVITPRLWKKGYIYASRSEILHRPGREVFFGLFSGAPRVTPPKSANEASDIPLIVLR